MRKILFIISSDPRISHRPAEAVRIAAGAGGWGRVEVNVCFTHPTAALLLQATDESLKDEEQFTACLPILRRPIYVLEGSLPAGTSDCEQIDLQGLARLTMRHDVVVRF